MPSKNMAAAVPIVLYTSRNCPWAHRAHIALAELSLPFQEVLVDYSKPRTPEYLNINPRGQVPSLTYGGQVILESAVIAQFLADSVEETSLTPRTGDARAALRRARVAVFTDTYFSKANIYYYRAIEAKTDEGADEVGKRYVEAIVKDVEPLLQDTDPFFGGSNKLTMAEVLVASFILRIFTLPYTENPPIPKSMIVGLEEKAPKFYAWAQAIMKHPSVNGIYNRDGCAAEMRERRAKARASA